MIEIIFRIHSVVPEISSYVRVQTYKQRNVQTTLLFISVNIEGNLFLKEITFIYHFVRFPCIKLSLDYEKVNRRVWVRVKVNRRYYKKGTIEIYVRTKNFML